MGTSIRNIASRFPLLFVAAVSFGLWAQPAAAPAQAARLTRAEKEQFLLKAEVTKTVDSKKGVTVTRRATLSDGTFTHEASLQKIDQTIRELDTPFGRMVNLLDSYRNNIAAYKLGKLLGLNMIPPSVERKWQGSTYSFTWWVDDVLMDEEDRQKKKVQAPDMDLYHRQMHVVHVFDLLIGNTDRNQGNMIFDKDWRLWMIDHSRAFILNSNLLTPDLLVQCDAAMLRKMRALDKATLSAELKDLVGDMKIASLLARRDKIVAFLDKKGSSGIFDLPQLPD